MQLKNKMNRIPDTDTDAATVRSRDDSIYLPSREDIESEGRPLPQPLTRRPYPDTERRRYLPPLFKEILFIVIVVTQSHNLFLFWRRHLYPIYQFMMQFWFLIILPIGGSGNKRISHLC